MLALVAVQAPFLYFGLRSAAELTAHSANAVAFARAITALSSVNFERSRQSDTAIFVISAP